MADIKRPNVLKKITQILIIASLLLFVFSFFLPSRLTSFDLETIFEFARRNQVGYQIYIILLFPIAFALYWMKYVQASFYFTTSFLFFNNDLFESLIDLFFNAIPFWTSGLFQFVIPLFLIILFGVIILLKSLQMKSVKWYLCFIFFILVFYLSVNDRNCTIDFVSEIGYSKCDFALWFNNCGTYYAWWISPILLNIGLYIKLWIKK